MSVCAIEESDAHNDPSLKNTKNIIETKMRLLSCQEVPSCVKSKTSAVFDPDTDPEPATMIMGRSSCNALLNIVHA